MLSWFRMSVVRMASKLHILARKDKAFCCRIHGNNPSFASGCGPRNPESPVFSFCYPIHWKSWIKVIFRKVDNNHYFINLCESIFQNCKKAFMINFLPFLKFHKILKKIHVSNFYHRVFFFSGSAIFLNILFKKQQHLWL